MSRLVNDRIRKDQKETRSIKRYLCVVLRQLILPDGVKGDRTMRVKRKGLRVALLLNLQVGYCRRAVTGVAAFAEKEGWLLEEMPATPESRDRLMRSGPDGVIAHILDEPLAEILGGIECPVVSVSSNLPSLPFPAVDVDHVAVGKMAADYLLDLGRRHFAFFGSSTAGFSLDRELGYVEVLGRNGYEVERYYAEYVLRPPFDEYSRGAEEKMRGWLGELEKPVVVFCSNDEHARMLSFLCQSSGVKVPDEVAILGVDNDLTICMMGAPPISSVDNPAEEIGYRAAEILKRGMGGERLGHEVELVAPARVVERPSTDRFAVGNGMVQRAVTYMRRNLRDEGMGVDRIAGHVGASRRSLERGVSKVLGMTVLGAIHRLRIRRAKSLLANTDLPVLTIAGECGFSNHRRFGVIFKSQAGVTPSQFRQMSRFEKW